MIGNIRALVLLVACTLTTLAMLPFYTLARWTHSPRRKSIEVKWHRAICWILNIRIEQRGAVAHPDGHGVLIAANHISWTDILVLGSLAPVSFVAKDEVRDWPLFGSFAKWQESVFIDRNVRSGAKQQASEINARLMAGDNIVLFPEGTTSDGNFLYPFKSSLFGALGVGSNVLKSPIQPVSIAYVSHHGLPMGRFDRQLASWPGDVQMMPHLKRIIREAHLGVIVSFGDPVAANGDMNRKQLTALVYDSVARMTSSALRGRDTLPSDDKTE